MADPIPNTAVITDAAGHTVTVPLGLFAPVEAPIEQTVADVKADNPTAVVTDVKMVAKEGVVVAKSLVSTIRNELYKLAGVGLAAGGATGVVAHGSNSTGGWVSVLAGAAVVVAHTLTNK